MDLSIVPTEDLWTEFSSRFAACIYAGLEHENPDSILHGKHGSFYEFFGSSVTCIGLAYLLLKYMDTCREIVDEEEQEDVER